MRSIRHARSASNRDIQGRPEARPHAPMPADSRWCTLSQHQAAVFLPPLEAAAPAPHINASSNAEATHTPSARVSSCPTRDLAEHTDVQSTFCDKKNNTLELTKAVTMRDKPAELNHVQGLKLVIWRINAATFMQHVQNACLLVNHPANDRGARHAP